MTVNMANALFMISLAIFASLSAAGLAVVLDRWWSNRQETSRAAESEAADLEKEFPNG
jgi:hypothetical protein